MNENVDLTKILDGCPMWTKFYSTIYDEISFKRIELSRDYPIIFDSDAVGGKITLTENGTVLKGVGECIVFPSKDQRDWTKFERFWDKKFDVTTLHYFDTVLVRNDMLDLWEIDFFSKLSNYSNSVVCNYDTWKQCIPYNDGTKHLVSTEEDCPEYYKWWEE